MRIVIMGVVAVLSYLLQATFFEYIKIFGIKPNFIVITTISYALIRGKEEGAVYGLSAGLLLDFMDGKVIGLYGLLGMYLGLIIGALNKNLYHENYLIAIALTAVGSFAYNLVHFIISFTTSGQDNLLWQVFHYTVPETIYNTCLSIFVYFIILYFNKKIDYKSAVKSFK